MGFLGNFLGQKAVDIHNALIQALVEFDPQTATAAQIATVEHVLGQTNKRLAELQVDRERVQKLVAAGEAAVKQHVGAAEILAGKGMGDKAVAMLDALEQSLAPKLDDDRRDLADIEKTIADVESRRGELETRLRTAKSRGETASRALERAKLEEARAKEAEDRARREAGLVRKLDQLDVAGAAMENATQAALARAQAARLQAESLGRVASGAATDADVQAALAQAASAPQIAPSLEDRLAAARARLSPAEKVEAITDARPASRG